MAKSQVVKEHSETLSGHSCRQAVGVGFVLMAILVPLYFSPLFYEYEIPKLVIFQVLTVAMAVLWVVGMVLDGEIYLLDTTIYYTFLAFLAVHFISLFQAGNVFQGMVSLLFSDSGFDFSRGAEAITHLFFGRDDDGNRCSRGVYWAPPAQ